MDLRIEIIKDKDGNKKLLPWAPIYKIRREELLVLRKTLIKLLGKEFIRVSNSPAAAPVLIIKKPRGGVRFYINYQALNSITKKD